MKAHRTDGLSLTFGLLFAAFVVWWVLLGRVDVKLPALGWLVAGALILFGLLGLLGALRANRAAHEHPLAAPVSAAPVSASPVSASPVSSSPVSAAPASVSPAPASVSPAPYSVSPAPYEEGQAPYEEGPTLAQPTARDEDGPGKDR